MTKNLAFLLLILCTTTQPADSRTQLAAACLSLLEAGQEINDNANNLATQPIEKKYCLPLSASCIVGAIGGLGVRFFCPGATECCGIITRVGATTGIGKSLYTLRNNQEPHKTLVNRKPTLVELSSAGAYGCALALKPQDCFYTHIGGYIVNLACSVEHQHGVMFGEI